MFTTILQAILVLALFLPVRYLAWKITEVWGLPQWLQYKPWVCNTCLTFWSLMAVYLTVGFAFQAWITMGGGIALAILNAIAMYVHQKNNTIKI